MDEYKVEERKISFQTYLPIKLWKTLNNEVFNLMNQHNLGNNFTIDNGELSGTIVASLNKTKKIK